MSHQTRHFHSKEPKGKCVIGESSQQGNRGTKCYICQDFGHFVAQCPTRNLLVERTLDQKSHEYEEEVYNPEDGISDAEGK